MTKYQNLNVLNQKKPIDYTQDSIDQVANMLKATGKNRSQRRRLERSLGKMETILQHTQSHVDRSAVKRYEAACDEHMRLFFALLGICLNKNYGWNEDQLEEIFDLLNTYLVEYGSERVDDICRILDELTGIQLVAE